MNRLIHTATDRHALVQEVVCTSWAPWVQESAGHRRRKETELAGKRGGRNFSKDFTERHTKLV